MGIKTYLRERLKETIEGFGWIVEGEIELTGPREPSWGDLTTNVAFQIAPQVGENPRGVAERISNGLALSPEFIERAEVADPGFINFYLARGELLRSLREIIERGEEYGRCNLGRGRRVQVEFVSSNPTGPLTVGHGRQATLGDAVASLLEWAGYRVEREYYFNDAGNQMMLLGESLQARYEQLFDPSFPFPPDGYKGDYLLEIAQELREERGEELRGVPAEEVLPIFMEYASRRIIAGIREDLERFGVRFDLWFKESSLYEEGKVEEAIEILRGKGHIYEKEGAVWFSSSRLGDERDRVLVKKGGEPTYLATDIAYHLDKKRRGFDWVIDVWGADHWGHVPSMRAAAKALGFSDGFLYYLVHQMVSFKKGGAELKMSTRQGTFITLRQMMEEIGRDVARFFYLTRGADSHLVFDLDLAKRESSENPAYYVQYAHARICSILEYAKKEGLSPAKEADLSILKEPEEVDLMKKLVWFPETVEGSARSLEPHRITTYLQDLASAFHLFYQRHRVVTKERKLSLARLILAQASLKVLKNGLRILGISAPEKM